MEKVIERFLKYISFDTQSEVDKETIPSTEKQFVLANYLVEELKQIGLEDVTVDEHAYVMATLPANTDKKIPTIGFIAHMDTSPDFSGTNVNPQIVENYQGQELVLNKENNLILSPDLFPELLNYKNQDLITTDGTTLLGADDKAGVAAIVTAMEELMKDQSIKHGRVRIAFTPDEEVGRGADLFDVKKFNAQWAYTIDGGGIGELEFENFNAAGARVIFNGKSVHPGEAKDKMVNSMTRAAEFILSLPQEEVPEHTEGYEGFFHLTNMDAKVDKTTLTYIIRDHDREKFNSRKQLMKKLVNDFKQKYGDDAIELELKDQYYNMREKIEPVMDIIDMARQAMVNLDIRPKVKPIRGGTDGARLSYMGLPCPNIFAGAHNFHGPYEFLPIPSLIKAKDVIKEIVRLTAE
jgi:tripeptide aminopeptidase